MMGTAHRRRRLTVIGLVFLAFGGGSSIGGEWDVTGFVAAEVRVFPGDPAFPDQHDATISPSLLAEPEFVYEWNEAADRLTVVPFARWDADDDNRTHADLREANWLHLGSRWDLVVGIDRVFWGVTESRHLVDTINQIDAVEDIDREDKLGQPMINFNLQRDWGTLRFFVLPGFRERTFPAGDARLRGPFFIDVDNAVYESRAEDRRVDGAVRWVHTFNRWDIGLAHFRGTSREPRLVPTARDKRIVLVPHYDLIDQSSLDAQLTTRATLWKLEAITRDGHDDRFFASVAGLEHTFYGAFASNIDVGILAEYLYDGRSPDAAPRTTADDDVFVGVRLSLNDVRDTFLLVGAIVDRNSRATLGFVEAERRVWRNWRLELEGRFFAGVPDEDPLGGIREDDFVTVRLSRFF